MMLNRENRKCDARTSHWNVTLGCHTGMINMNNINNEVFKDLGSKKKRRRSIYFRTFLMNFFEENPEIVVNKIVNDALEKYISNEYHYVILPRFEWVLSWFCSKCGEWQPATSKKDDIIKMRKTVTGWCRNCKKLFRLYSRSKNLGLMPRFQIKVLKCPEKYKNSV